MYVRTYVHCTPHRHLIHTPQNLKVRLYTARTRTRPTRTRTRPRLLGGFAIQIEHELEHGKPSTDYKAARLLLALDIKFGHLES